MSMAKSIQLAAAAVANRSLGPKGLRSHCLLNSQLRTHLKNSTRLHQIAASNFHSSPSPCSSDSFHGLSLDEKVEADQNSDTRINSRIDAVVQEAEVVKTEDDKRKTRELIAELVRAEMLAYSSPKVNDEVNSDSKGKAQVLSPYEKQMVQLQQALEQHFQISGDSIEYSKSCRYVGEIHYKMGQMEQSQEILFDGLQGLIESDLDGDKKEVQLLKAQIMHLLGACLARCGEFDDASSWYEESLKLKQDLLRDSSDDTSRYHYELGKTFNGLATLEIMSGGGNANWEKATTLFQDADKHYLHDFRQFEDKDTAFGWEDISNETVQLMSPYLVQLVVNVRSNMGELLKQQGRHTDAVELFQLALDLAQMNVTRMNEPINVELEQFGEDEPSPEERRNAVVDLLVTIADCHAAYENYDEAAASYEQALISHVTFRRLTGNERNESTAQLIENLNTRLPTAAMKTASIPLDLANATTVEAAIRNNLAYSLTRINQAKLALDQYEIALQIKRHIGGNNNFEVGRTLMEMGALLGGPMKDLAAALNCFKEALHIYRLQRDEIVQANSNREENSRQAFYDADLELGEINEHVQNASKNIALIEDALLQNKGGVSKTRRP